MPDDSTPTLEGFQTFVRDIMQVPGGAVPPDGVLGMVFRLANDLVIRDLRLIDGSLYTDCVYNLAASYLLKFAQDTASSTPPGYWAKVREQLGMNSTTPGLIQSSSDNGTSQSWMIPDSLKNLSLADLDAMKNPYGQFYLSIMQQYGSVWGWA
ncbi:hypothetical protein [Parasaccharibacter sp. TMW2.1890]|uniref:hypothetical protein n=1 Tax=Parasaccharibacter sp. TMW2.1890 TaxID=2039289 RepID=UPI0020115DDA|nr:hypothetical protein [Parasaccharibacter sp. TMW2.1890]MCL1515210.1 hypothetical protein [Parasaccharibacter sp. TMW2.1890]